MLHLSQTVWALSSDHGDHSGSLCGSPLQRPEACELGTTLQLQVNPQSLAYWVKPAEGAPKCVKDACLCVQSTRGGRWGSVCRGSGFPGGLHHLLLHLPSLSGDDTTLLLLTSGLALQPCDFFSCFCPFYFTLFSFSLSVIFVTVLLSLPPPAVPQCVCTLSPSPSKQPKPIPLDSLQLPLAPGLVTHTVSLNGPLLWEWTLLVILGFLIGFSPHFCLQT